MIFAELYCTYRFEADDLIYLLRPWARDINFIRRYMARAKVRTSWTRECCNSYNVEEMGEHPSLLPRMRLRSSNMS
jgi:hypothetical protein